MYAYLNLCVADTNGMRVCVTMCKGVGLQRDVLCHAERRHGAKPTTVWTKQIPGGLRQLAGSGCAPVRVTMCIMYPESDLVQVPRQTCTDQLFDASFLFLNRYFNVAKVVIDRYDPNHLILGVRGQNIASTPCPGRQLLCEEARARLSSGHAINMTAVWKAMRGLVDVFNFHDYSDVPPKAELQRVFKAIYR